MREIAFRKVSEVMRPPLTFSATDTVSRFLVNIQKLETCEALVVFKNRMGIVTALDILDTVHPEQTILGNVAKRSTSITGDATIAEAVDAMISNKLRALPVMDRGKVVGMVSCADVLAAMMRSSSLRKIVCRDVMRQSMLSVRSHDKISTARSIMCRHGVDHLPVVDEEGMLEGVVTARHMVLVFVQPSDRMTEGEMVGESARAWDAPVRAIMDAEPLTAGEDDPLVSVVKALGRRGKEVCVVEGPGRRSTITPMEVIALLLRFKVERTVHVRILGLPASGEFLSIETIQNKVRRVLSAGFAFHRDVREVVIDVKSRKRGGKKTLYQIIAKVYSSLRPLTVTAHGWYLAEAFDELRSKLDRVLRKSKRRRPRA